MNYYFWPEMSNDKNWRFLSRIDPRLRLLSFFVLFFLVLATPPKKWQTFSWLFLSLCLMAVLGGFAPKFFIQALVLTFPWMAFVSLTVLLKLKSLAGETSSILVNLWGKMIMTIMLLSIYKMALPLPAVIRALSQAKLPPLFLSLFFLSSHFLQLLGEEAQRMHQALICRSFGKINFRRKIKILWSLMNSLFDRALGRSQQLLAAMLSRGFSGRLLVRAPGRLTTADYLFLFSLLLLTIYIFLT